MACIQYPSKKQHKWSGYTVGYQKAMISKFLDIFWGIFQSSIFFFHKIFNYVFKFNYCLRNLTNFNRKLRHFIIIENLISFLRWKLNPVCLSDPQKHILNPCVIVILNTYIYWNRSETRKTIQIHICLGTNANRIRTIPQKRPLITKPTKTSLTKPYIISCIQPPVRIILLANGCSYIYHTCESNITTQSE